MSDGNEFRIWAVEETTTRRVLSFNLKIIDFK